MLLLDLFSDFTINNENDSQYWAHHVAFARLTWKNRLDPSQSASAKQITSMKVNDTFLNFFIKHMKQYRFGLFINFFLLFLWFLSHIKCLVKHLFQSHLNIQARVVNFCLMALCAAPGKCPPPDRNTSDLTEWATEKTKGRTVAYLLPLIQRIL